MRRIFSNQRGQTLLEMILASGLFATVVLMATAGEFSLARERADARSASDLTLKIQSAMGPILRDIARAWGDAATGAPAVTLQDPDAAAGCSTGTRILLASGAQRVEWALDEEGRLLRTVNGQPGQPLGTFSSLCFSMDANDRTVRVTIGARDVRGHERHLEGGSTPEGVR